MSNIAEGFERAGDKEFSQFLAIAKGSAAEVKSQAYVARDADLISQEEFNQVAGMTEEIMRMIGALVAYLRTSPYKGHKHRPRSKE